MTIKQRMEFEAGQAKFCDGDCREACLGRAAEYARVLALVEAAKVVSKDFGGEPQTIGSGPKPYSISEGAAFGILNALADMQQHGDL